MDKGKCPFLLRWLDDIRTIIQRQTEYIYIPDLAP